MCYTISKSHTWKALKQAVVILNLAEGSYYTLNDTASLIWKKLMNGSSSETIATCLHEEFECGLAEARTDVTDYIEACLSEGILEKT